MDNTKYNFLHDFDLENYNRKTIPYRKIRDIFPTQSYSYKLDDPQSRINRLIWRKTHEIELPKPLEYSPYHTTIDSDLFEVSKLQVPQYSSEYTQTPDDTNYQEYQPSEVTYEPHYSKPPEKRVLHSTPKKSVVTNSITENKSITIEPTVVKVEPVKHTLPRTSILCDPTKAPEKIRPFILDLRNYFDTLQETPALFKKNFNQFSIKSFNNLEDDNPENLSYDVVEDNPFGLKVVRFEQTIKKPNNDVEKISFKYKVPKNESVENINPKEAFKHAFAIEINLHENDDLLPSKSLRLFSYDSKIEFTENKFELFNKNPKEILTNKIQRYVRNKYTDEWFEISTAEQMLNFHYDDSMVSFEITPSGKILLTKLKAFDKENNPIKLNLPTPIDNVDDEIVEKIKLILAHNVTLENPNDGLNTTLMKLYTYLDLKPEHRVHYKHPFLANIVKTKEDLAKLLNDSEGKPVICQISLEDKESTKGHAVVAIFDPISNTIYFDDTSGASYLSFANFFKNQSKQDVTKKWKPDILKDVKIARMFTNSQTQFRFGTCATQSAVALIVEYEHYDLICEYLKLKRDRKTLIEKPLSNKELQKQALNEIDKRAKEIEVVIANAKAKKLAEYNSLFAVYPLMEEFKKNKHYNFTNNISKIKAFYPIIPSGNALPVVKATTLDEECLKMIKLDSSKATPLNDKGIFRIKNKSLNTFFDNNLKDRVIKYKEKTINFDKIIKKLKKVKRNRFFVYIKTSKGTNISKINMEKNKITLYSGAAIY